MKPKRTKKQAARPEPARPAATSSTTTDVATRPAREMAALTDHQRLEALAELFLSDRPHAELRLILREQAAKHVRVQRGIDHAHDVGMAISAFEHSFRGSPTYFSTILGRPDDRSVEARLVPLCVPATVSGQAVFDLLGLTLLNRAVAMVKAPGVETTVLWCLEKPMDLLIDGEAPYRALLAALRRRVGLRDLDHDLSHVLIPGSLVRTIDGTYARTSIQVNDLDARVTVEDLLDVAFAERPAVPGVAEQAARSAWGEDQR
jgi:hypothetical protein